MTDENACVLCALRDAVHDDIRDLGRRASRGDDLDPDAALTLLAARNRLLCDAGEHDPATRKATR